RRNDVRRSRQPGRVGGRDEPRRLSGPPLAQRLLWHGGRRGARGRIAGRRVGHGGRRRAGRAGRERLGGSGGRRRRARRAPARSRASSRGSRVASCDASGLPGLRARGDLGRVPRPIRHPRPRAARPATWERPLRLLHVVPTYLPAWRHGGPIRAVHGLARSLVARGHQVEVFTTNLHGSGRLDVPLATPVDLDGVSVRYFPFRSLARLAYAPTMRAALADISRFDAVHLHSVFLWPTLAAARAAERAGKPWLVAPRGMLVPELIAARGRLRKTLWLRMFERRTIERAAGFHATTDLEARDAERLGLHVPLVFVVLNGVAAEFWSGEFAALAPAVYRLIEALAAVHGAHLAIAGNDEERLTPRLERLAAEMGVAERVYVLGPVEGKEKAA